METLANLECFVRSAETLSFSEAARRLSLTPAAVSRNVAALERNLGVRLFQRSTRRLALTEAGERFLGGIDDKLDGLQAVIADIANERGEPAGTLKVSLPLTLGMRYILPLLPDFRVRYPAVRIDWHLDNRPVDLIAEGFDAAIGGGFELGGGIIARRLAPAHLVAVAAPSYMAGRTAPTAPGDLAAFAGIAMRIGSTGRLSDWTMRDMAGREEAVPVRPAIILNDPVPIAEAALLGLGVALLAVPDVLPHLGNGSLIRLLPGWFADRGAIALYHATPTLLPRKTRVFIDFITGHFHAKQLAERFSAI
jgi:DNA-binding transcriptional LysR family regulator